MHRFSLLDKKWEKLKHITLPPNMRQFGVVSTRDERYIILFGGCDLDNIYIYDTRNNILRKSDIKCPMRGDIRATISDDLDEDKLVTSGFINRCYKGKDFMNVQLLPFYLIELISKWYQNQNVYLLKQCADAGTLSDFESLHFTINIDHILQ